MHLTILIQTAKIDEFNQRAHNAATGNKFTINAEETKRAKKQNTETNIQ